MNHFHLRNKLSLLVALYLTHTAIAQGSLLTGDYRQKLFEKWSDQRANLYDIRGLRPYSFAHIYDHLEQPDETSQQSALSQDLKNELLRLKDPSFSLFDKHIKFFASITSGYSFSRSPSTETLQVKSVTNPLLNASSLNHEGRFLEGGSNGFIEMPITLSFDSWLDLHVSPLLTASSKEAPFQKSEDLRLQRLYARFHLNNLSLQIGRDSVDWGVGRLNHLMFSGDNRPLDLIRLRNDQAIVLPWLFKGLGPMMFEAFITKLDSDQVIKNPLVIGTKASFKPSEQFEFGLGYTVQLGGKGAPTQNPAVYFGEVFSDSSGSTNRLFVFDLRYRFKSIPLETYAEIMFEDCCDGIIVNPRDTLNLFGIHLPNVDGKEKLDLTLEWARTSYITYKHGTFTSGTSYKNQLLGHPIGPDGNGIYAGSRYWWSSQLNTGTLWSYEVRGRSGASLSRDGTDPISAIYPYYQVPEQRFKLMSHVQWTIPDSSFIRSTVILAEAGLEWVTAYNFQQFAYRKNAIIGLSVQSHF